jgi:phage repressor protein C with HTH and peptisase S24 domain
MRPARIGVKMRPGKHENAMTKFTHAAVWRAIDRTAEAHSLSASGLAKAAGLDATAFNESKRVRRTKKPRRPSVETIAKVLDSVGDSVEDFVKRLNGRGDKPAAARRSTKGPRGRGKR